MIDIGNSVYDAVASALRAEFPEINVSSRLILAPEAFPCVTVEEADNYVYTRGIDSGGFENYAELMYEINVFSNRKSGAKEECRQIFSVIDRAMSIMGFVRTGRSPAPGGEATRFRLVSRYHGVADADSVIYVK